MDNVIESKETIIAHLNQIIESVKSGERAVSMTLLIEAPKEKVGGVFVKCGPITYDLHLEFFDVAKEGNDAQE